MYLLAWRWMSVCVGLLVLTDNVNIKGEAAPTLQPTTLRTSTHTPEVVEDEYHTSIGHVIALPCDDADESQNVTWRREGAPPLDTVVAGAEVRGAALWFLPADSSHSGVYVCERSDAEPWLVSLHVDSGPCPKNNCVRYLNLKEFGRLKCCEQEDIFASVTDVHITWLKDCKVVNGSEKTLDLPNVSIHDKGNYTCLLHFSLEGHHYTSSSTTEVFIKGADQLSKPQVILPRNDTRLVQLGSHLELHCEATDGKDTLLVAWTMNGLIIKNNTLFTVTERALETRIVKTLIISEVRVEHLNIPFQCWATNSLGQSSGQIILQKASQELFYCMVGMAVACGLLLVCVYLCWHFRVELVLLHRSFCPRHKQYDGKLYDAYVSYPSGNSISMAMTFALRVLPEVLESNFGYKLFIRGRDDLPGEAVFDVTDKALAKSRRLIIVLGGTEKDTHTHTDTQTDTDTPLCEEAIPLALTDTQTTTHTKTNTESDTHTHTNTPQERIPLTLTHTHTHANAPHSQTDTPIESGAHTEPLSLTHTSTHTPQQRDTHTEGEQVCFEECVTHTDTQACEWQVCFERSLGQYEALVNSGLKVLIIQMGEEGSDLPPPLQLLTRTRRPLRWNTHTHTSSQRRFWRELRYNMPAPRRTVNENTHTHTTPL